PINILAILKYIIKLIASTIVVISGPAIIAGSSLAFLASIGNIPPITLAKVIVHIRVNETNIETGSPTLSKNIHFKKFTEPNIKPTNKDTLNSLNKTFDQSLNLISPVAKPRIISVD